MEAFREMSKKFNNTSKENFLRSIPTISIDGSGIEKRCKFNFSYFDDSQSCGQRFVDWNSGSTSLSTLLEKIKNFTKEPLEYWLNERAGGGGLKVLALYDSFPRKSDFTHPLHVPHDVTWGRFRLGNKVRLIGFVVNKEICTELNKKSAHFNLDENTFYVVFLDRDHKFYKTEKS